MRHGTDKVTILRDPGVKRERYCWTLLHMLRAAIQATFNATVLVLGPGTLVHDLSLMVQARAFISSVSSLGLFAGLASHGTAYLPVSHQAAGRTTPCFAHSDVRWYQTTYFPAHRLNHRDKEVRANIAIEKIPKLFAPGRLDLIKKGVESLETNLGPWANFQDGHLHLRETLQKMFYRGSGVAIEF